MMSFYAKKITVNDITTNQGIWANTLHMKCVTIRVRPVPMTRMAESPESRAYNRTADNRCCRNTVSTTLNPIVTMLQLTDVVEYIPNIYPDPGEFTRVELPVRTTHFNNKDSHVHYAQR